MHSWVDTWWLCIMMTWSPFKYFITSGMLQYCGQPCLSNCYQTWYCSFSPYLEFVSAPTSIHFRHLLRVLRYLRGASSCCLFHACDIPLQLHAYSDSTWVSDPTDHQSHRHSILLGSSPLNGSPRKKPLYLALVQRQNFEHLLLPLQRLYGFDGC